MNKKETQRTGLLKYILFAPIIAGLVFGNSLQAQDNTKSSESKEETVQTEVKKDSVYMVVDVLPSFPGGDKALAEYLSKNLKYPKVAAKEGKQGRVICRFIVRSTGEIDDIEVLRSVRIDLDSEAIRVIRNMPKWIPGKQDGKEVDVYYSIPIRFQLPK